MTGTQKIHPIGYVARQTGLSAHVIRAWEKRYGTVRPHRTPSGRRLYSDSDIQHLQLIRQSIGAGHRIAQLSKLNTESLRAIAAKRPAGAPMPALSASELCTPEDYVRRCRSAILELDEQAFETALNQAAVTLTRPTLFEEVIVPLAVEIGERWAEGDLKIINEHMASSILNFFLRDMLYAFRPLPPMPKMIVATPMNHWHELGALIAGIVAAEAGWGVYYFGPNLPAEEIAAAAVSKSAAAVALSVVSHDAGRQTLREIKKLRQFLDEGVAVIVGGSAVRSYQAELAQLNVRHPLDMAEFRDTLATLV